MPPRVPYCGTLVPHPSLWQRPRDGLFFAIWYDPQPDGSLKRRQTSMKVTNRDLARIRFNAWLATDWVAGDPSKKALAKVRSGPNGPTWSSFAREFLTFKEGTVAFSTLRLYSDALRRFQDLMGDVPLSQISQKHLDQFTGQLKRTVGSSATTNKYLRHLRAVFRVAYEWEYTPKPLAFKKIGEPRALRFIGAKDFRAIIRAAAHDPEWQDFILFAAYTALRSGEILRLGFRDIDNPQGFIRVSNLQKNRQEDRIPINDGAREILVRCRSRRHRSPIFRFTNVFWVSQKFQKTLEKIGLKGRYRFHDLRHTYATNLVSQGVGIYTVKELLRHRAIESTTIYAKVKPAHLVESSAQVRYDLDPEEGSE